MQNRKKGREEEDKKRANLQENKQHSFGNPKKPKKMFQRGEIVHLDSNGEPGRLPN